MVRPILFAAALAGMCAAASPLATRNNGNNGNGNGSGNGNGNGNNGNGNSNGKGNNGNNGKGNKASSTTSSVSLSTTSLVDTVPASASTSSSSTFSTSTLTLSSSTSTSSAPVSISTSLAPVITSTSPGTCFNATIRKEYLLQITTFEPYNPYDSAVNNVNQVRFHIADPTNQNQDAITCTDARWNSTNQLFPSDYLTCDDPTISYKLTSWTNLNTFSLIVNQTFVQGSFSETILASYNATESDLDGYGCYANSGCSAYYMNGGQGHAIVYDVQKNGPQSTTFPDQCPPAPLPTVSDWPIRYSSIGSANPADTSVSVASFIGFDLLTNVQNGYRVKCNGPTWDSTTQSAQPADWYPCPYIDYIPGNWSFRVESYTDYKTFNLGIKQHICNEVQCQDNLAYANLTAATFDPNYSGCDAQNKCKASSAFTTINAPSYAIVNEMTIS